VVELNNGRHTSRFSWRGKGWSYIYVKKRSRDDVGWTGIMHTRWGSCTDKYCEDAQVLGFKYLVFDDVVG
jgi:hypothetical protein